MQAALPPFHCSYTPALAELLAQLECSLVLSTYQAGKVIFLSSDGVKIGQLLRTFDTPMGLALDGDRLAVATKQEVVVFTDSPELAGTYPRKPNYYDSMFLPRAVFFTGQLAMHDLAWIGEELIGVNTSFSCLCKINPAYSFTPVWKPPFISDLQHQDRCHLNGMAVDGERVKYVTALGESDEVDGWRMDKTRAGVLIDVESGEVVLRNLPMPHSPRIINGELYMLCSAVGEVVRVDAGWEQFEVVNKINGFVRGMAHYGDYLFVATSRLRKTHTFADLELARRQDLFCGVTAIYLPTGAIVGQLVYENSCEEIYDILIVPGKCRPNILRYDQDIHLHALSIPEATYWAALPDES